VDEGNREVRDREEVHVEEPEHEVDHLQQNQDPQPLDFEAVQGGARDEDADLVADGQDDEGVLVQEVVVVGVREPFTFCKNISKSSKNSILKEIDC
jgi:hypothetical protein